MHLRHGRVVDCPVLHRVTGFQQFDLRRVAHPELHRRGRHLAAYQLLLLRHLRVRLDLVLVAVVILNPVATH